MRFSFGYTKRLLLLLSLWLATNSLYAQKDKIPKDLYNKELGIPSTEKQVLPDADAVRSVLNRQFSTIINGSLNNSIGNFAALDLKETEVSIGFSKLFEKSGSVLTFKTAGGVQDNFYSLFSHTKFNTNISFEVVFNQLSLGKREMWMRIDSLKSYARSKSLIEQQFLKEEVVLESKLAKQRQENDTKKSEAEKSLAAFIAQFDNETDNQAKARIKDSITLMKLTIDSIRIDSVFISSRSHGYYQLVVNKNQALQKLDLMGALEEMKFGWLSYGYSISNNSVKLLNAQLPAADQVSDESFAIQELKAQYSYYSWSKKNFGSYYWHAGIAGSLSNNVDDLEKVEVVESKLLGESDVERRSEEKFNAYTGTYSENLKGIRLYGDYYRFLFSGNWIALHGLAEWKIRDKVKPVINSGLGLYFSLKDSKSETSRVNMELIAKLEDIGNSKAAESNFLQRATVGIQFAFPIKFKY